MMESNIGIIGAILGTAIGFVGGLYGGLCASKSVIRTIMRDDKTSQDEKLRLINLYIKTVFRAAITTVVFLSILALAIYYKPTDSWTYLGVIITLQIGFIASLLYIFRNYQR